MVNTLPSQPTTVAVRGWSVGFAATVNSDAPSPWPTMPGGGDNAIQSAAVDIDHPPENGKSARTSIAPLPGSAENVIEAPELGVSRPRRLKKIAEHGPSCWVRITSCPRVGESHRT